VLHRELSIDPEALAGIVRAALDGLHFDEVCRVRAHPADAAALRAALEKTSAARMLEVQPDGTLERGAAIVETGRGKLDASVETQLAEIERGLADRLRRHSS
jgi:flagellar assembly protein FliH